MIEYTIARYPRNKSPAQWDLTASTRICPPARGPPALVRRRKRGLRATAICKTLVAPPSENLTANTYRRGSGSRFGPAARDVRVARPNPHGCLFETPPLYSDDLFAL